MIPYGRQDITADDIAAVTEVLTSDFLTQGPAVPAFEQALCDYTGAAHAVAANSATSALHIACLALGAGPGERVWTSPNTFVASANCALYCGAEIDFVDIDPRTYNLCADQLAEKLARAEKENRLPHILIPVHFAGQSCDMQRIHALSQQYGFRIIEDASHAVGGRYQDQPVGNCRYSDITIFSFHPVKIITTAEGGVALTNDPALAARMASLRSHGITRDSSLMQSPSDGPWYYQQLELGFNYRMTDMQAALGCSQIKRLDDYVARRHRIAQRYDNKLAQLDVTLPHQSSDSHSALHLYPVQVDPGKRLQVFTALREAGIGVNVHYIPVHRQPYYDALGFHAGQFPNAERYYAGAISLPMFPTLTETDQDTVIRALGAALQ